jgi:hypothetical protein
MMVVPLVGVFLLIGVYLGGKATGVDFKSRIQQRLESLVPSERTTKTVKAWDSRIGGAIAEVQFWFKSPLIGCGFGHYNIYHENGLPVGGYGHNSWTFELYQTGLAGLISCAMVVGGMWVVGRRMVLTGVDRTFVFIGAMGAITAVWFLFHGLSTASFNTPRPALTLGLTFGAVLRARAMQLTMKRQLEEEQQAWASGELEYQAADGAYLQEPVFGNWY